jgi:hypothetical protein
MRVVVSGLAVLAFLGAANVRAEGDYTLTINGQAQDLELGKDKVVTLPDGAIITLKVERKEFVTYSRTGFSFEHPGSLAVASRELDRGLWQHFLASPEGTLVMIQTYDDVDTTTLVDLMMGKMTDDDVAAGAAREISADTRTLSNGAVISGKSATLKKPGDDVLVEVLAKKQGAGGAIVMTRIDHASDSALDAAMIERFWATLKVD